MQPRPLSKTIFFARPNLCKGGLLAILLLTACARQGAPAGGPKDTTPPAIDTLASTPNFSTRFDKKRIELKFDEWVVLSDVSTQVMVSPPLAKRPDVALRGKTVVVSFDKNEVLRSNTTYTINFGTAVKDLHEGNPAKDLRFVFSTGEFIDSLSFSGVLTDAFTGDPVENISVMLYENFADSAVRKDRPYYFSRTDKSGQYEFKNLRAGAFRVVAIDDADQNLRWDGENERIAFRDSALMVNDTMRGLVGLKLFKNQPKFRLSGQNANIYGLVKLGFSAPAESYEVKTIAPESLVTLPEKTTDSLMLWYDLPTGPDTAWALLFSNLALPTRDSSGQALRFDTIAVRKWSRSEFLKNRRIHFADVGAPPSAKTSRNKTSAPAPPPAPLSAKTVVQSPALPAKLPFNVPIAAFDTALWVLTVDSSRLTAYDVLPDSASPRSLLLQVGWKQGKTYALRLLPGALTDFWGVPNADTLLRNYNLYPEKQLGSLSLGLENLRPGSQYVLQLLSGTTLEAERVFAAGGASAKLVFEHLQVATYSARLVEDLNRNGRWDTGDFNAGRQPEPVFNKKFDALRANWSLEVAFDVGDPAAKKRKQ